MSDPLPPHSIWAELGVIGSALKDNEQISGIATIIRLSDLYRNDHQIIYRAILELSKGGPVDAITLDDYLSVHHPHDTQRLNETIAEALKVTVCAANGPCYAAIVQEKAQARAVIEIADEARRQAYQQTQTALEIVAEAIARLGSVEARSFVDKVTADDVATLADAQRVIGQMRWFWKGWIAAGCMNVLAADGAVGKTRLAMELTRLLHKGEPFPDGSENPHPAGTRTLWLLVDRNWSETADVAQSFGVPLEAIYLNAPKSAPLTIPEFDDPATIRRLEAMIRELKPGLTIIDTITYATNRNTARAEETKAAFDAIMQLAAVTGAPILALTHLNKEGEVLNRRITERARSVLSLTRPDPDEQPDRRKLWVSKSAVKAPPALGMTLTGSRCEFDTNPPVAPLIGGKPRGPRPSKSLEHAQWLWEQLKPGPQPVVKLVDLARTDGILKAPTAEESKPSISPLYNARERLPRVHPGYHVIEWEEEPAEHGKPGRLRVGGRPRKYWELEPDRDAATDDPPF